MIGLNTDEDIEIANLKWIEQALILKYDEKIVKSYNYQQVVPIIQMLLAQGMQTEMIRDIYAHDLAGIKFSRLCTLYCVDRTTVRLEVGDQHGIQKLIFKLPNSNLWNELYQLLIKNPYFVEEKNLK